jgi:hypothetical protein
MAIFTLTRKQFHPNYGGRRKGAGRKPVADPSQKMDHLFQITWDEPLRARFYAGMKTAGARLRSQYARRLLESWLKDPQLQTYKMGTGVGVLRVTCSKAMHDSVSAALDGDVSSDRLRSVLHSILKAKGL